MAWLKAPKHNYFLYLIAGAVFLYIGVVGVRAFQDSALLSHPDRINVAFYGEEAIVLSFGLTDNVNYIVSLSHEQKITIPGGYNQYPLGSLGKLVELEKDPGIIQRTFSSMISAYVNYYVSPTHPEVYQKPDTDAPQYKRLDLIEKIFLRQYQTNMNIFDRFFIAYLIAKRRQQDYVVLRSSVIFSEKNFQKKYKGFFYHQTLRQESAEVQIKYNVYKSALTLSRVIEGGGIRVVDLSLSERAEKDVPRCLIRIDGHNKNVIEKSRHTLRFLSKTFSCPIEKGDTEGADIVIYLGKALESIWE